jgi:IS30 family transposase
MPRGAKIKTAIRQRIAELLRQGKSQVEIGKIIDRAPGTVAHYVRALGIPAKDYSKHRAKRRCASCRKMKTLGAFPNERQLNCSVCIRARDSTGSGVNVSRIWTAPA